MLLTFSVALVPGGISPFIFPIGIFIKDFVKGIVHLQLLVPSGVHSMGRGGGGGGIMQVNGDQLKVNYHFNEL